MKKEAIFDQVEKAMAPAKTLNELALKNTEALVKMQLAAMEDYSKISLENWKSALEVNDAASLQEYANKQREVAQSVAQKVAEDTQAVVELSKGYADEARKVFEESFADLKVKAA